MNVLFSKLFRETLAERANAKLACGERASGDVSAKGGGGTSEDEGAPRAILVEVVLFEGQDCATGKGEGGGDIDLEGGLDVLLCDVKEVLPDAVTGVPDGDTELGLVGR